MFVGKPDKDRQHASLMALLLDTVIRKTEKSQDTEDYFDKVISQINGINSGKMDWYAIDHKIYDTVRLATTMNPNLFKDSIPDDAYKQLQDLFDNYDKWKEKKKEKKITRQTQMNQMYLILKFMREQQKKGIKTFHLEFVSDNTITIIPHDVIVNLYGHTKNDLTITLKNESGD
jgi:hypothetical protein